jgi:hypothetical protein
MEVKKNTANATSGGIQRAISMPEVDKKHRCCNFGKTVLK